MMISARSTREGITVAIPGYVFVSSNYNDQSSRIAIQLGEVYDQATNMQADLETIKHAWERTMFWWDQLKLAWVGKTQAEVDTFQQDIDKVCHEIFGTSKPDPKNPNNEILDKAGLYQLAGDVALGAVQTYHYADWDVANMFTHITADITGGAYGMGFGPNGQYVLIQKPKPDGTLEPDQTKPYISETFST
jgi:hypothetical protein